MSPARQLSSLRITAVKTPRAFAELNYGLAEQSAIAARPANVRSRLTPFAQFFGIVTTIDTGANPTRDRVAEDELRLLRTELELLRRIQRRTAGHRGCRARPSVGDRDDSRYLSVDRLEVQGILRDADHPIVDVMIERFDMELGEIRKDIAMSAVNDEAEKTVTEAKESGAMLTGDPEPTGRTPGTLPPAIDEALAAAEADLAKAIGVKERTDQAYGKARGLLDEIRKLQRQAVQARDEINQLRDAARRLRDDAKKAEQRANNSAEAAELAADQAQREAEHVQNLQPVPC